MTDRAAIEKLIRDAYAARATKDAEAIARMFTPDGTFRLAGSTAAFPAAIPMAGAAELRSGIGALVEAFDFLELEMLASVIEGDKASVHWRVRARFNLTGEVFDTELYDLWTFANGRVASLVQFCDTALIADVMGRAPAVKG
jgi:ketosteroid isomerase-like protein